MDLPKIYKWKQNTVWLMAEPDIMVPLIEIPSHGTFFSANGFREV